MRLIGLCGRSGSGKSYFAALASEMGFVVADCDLIYRGLVSKPSQCLEEIKANFGDEVLLNGALNRPYLAKIVFSDKSKLALLNSITHKYVLKEVEAIIAKENKDAQIIIDAPQLFESGFNQKCDLIIGVASSDEVALERIMERDKISKESALARLSGQKELEFFEKNCQILIYNNGSLAQFEEESTRILKEIKEGKI